MLIEREVVDLLLERRLLSPAKVVDGDVAIHDVSRRNRSFCVVSRSGPSYFVKLPHQPDGHGAVAREASFYEAIQSRPTARHLPVFYGYQPEHRLDRLPGGDSRGGRRRSSHPARARAT